MARISFESLLKNPLVLGLLGTEMTGNLAKSYTEAQNQQRAEEEQQAKKLETIGQAGGAEPTGTERGMFGKLAAKTGLIPEQAPLTQYENAAYQVGATARATAQQGLVDAAIAKRSIIGPGQSWLNFSKDFTAKTGLQLPDLSAPTPKEVKEGQGGKIVWYAKDGKERDIVTPYVPGTTIFAPPGYSAAKLPRPPISEAEKVDTAGKEAYARGKAGEKVYFEGDAAMPIHNTVMYDADMNPVTKKGMTREQVLAAGGAAYSPKEQDSIAEAKGLDKQFDDLRRIINAKLLSSSDGSFQTRAGANQVALNAAAGKYQVFGVGMKATDPDAFNLVYAPNVLSIRLARLMTQQRLNQREIDTVSQYIGGLSGKSREVALDNLNKAQEFVDLRLRKRIKASADDTAGKIGRDYATSFWGEAPEAPPEAPIEQPPEEPEEPEEAAP